MADESQNQGGSAQEDPTKNVKAEFDRKLQAISEQIAAQNQFYAEQFTNIQNTIKQKAAPVVPEQTDADLEKLAYNDPVKYSQVITNRATQAATEAATRIASANQERQNLLVQMVAEYPELNDPSSEMYNKVIAATKGLSQAESSNNLIVKGLISTTAAELGVLPKSKRTGPATDGFSFGGSRGIEGSAPRGKSAKLDDKTLLFAQLMGRDINDPKVIERLESASKRDTWNKYR